MVEYLVYIVFRYHPLPSYIVLYRPIPSYTVLYHPIPSYTVIYHPIPSYTILYHPVPSYTIIYHTIPSYIILYLINTLLWYILRYFDNIIIHTSLIVCTYVLLCWCLKWKASCLHDIHLSLDLPELYNVVDCS